MASSRPQAAFSQNDIVVLTTLGKRKADLAQQRREYSNQIETIKEKEDELKAKRLRFKDLDSNLERFEFCNQQRMLDVHRKFEVVPDLEHDLMVAITDKSPK